MGAKVISIDKNWWKREREPEKSATRLAVVNPESLDELKGCPKILTVQRIADLLDFSPYSVSEWCRKDLLEAKKVRGRWRVTREALARFLVQGNLE